MSRYDRQGALDDQTMVDGDGAFIGMNLRDRPQQLREGEVTLSKNGRIEGGWEARRGIELKSGALSSSSNPLTLPFILLDAAVTIATASRLSNVVTINTSVAHGIDSVDLPAYVTLGNPSVGTSPIAGIGAGSYLMSYVDADTLTFANVGVDDPVLSVDGTYGFIGTYVDDNAVSNIYGTCVFSDPDNDLAESVFIATGNDVKKVLLSDYTVSSVAYPAGLVVSSNVEMIQAFDRIYLFRDGARAFEYVPKGKAIQSGSYTSTTGIVQLVCRDHGLTAGDTVVISDVGYSLTPTVANPNGTHTVSAVVDADTFRYVIATGSGDETYTVNTGKMTAAGFTLTPAGVYTQPQYFNIAGNKYGVSNGVVRFTVVGNTTIVAGDRIRISATDVAFLSPVIGQIYVVTSANSTDIYFDAPLPDISYGSGSGSDFVEFGSRFSLGLGFTHMPAIPWGVYFQRRLWCPYFYQPTGTRAVPTYEDRGVRDEICASDILDPNTFDSVLSQFRVTAGIADYLVALHPFYEDSMIVFNRNSIHLITGTQGTLSDTVLKEMTREVGCLARKSVASKGNLVMFLADDGVYALEFMDEYNLRGVEEPLSKPIQPFVDRINKRLASGAIGTYFDNRYYLAVPLDSVVGADDADGNNSVLIFNLKNKAWESIDTYGNNDFFITNFLKGQAEERNELYIVNSNGGLHLLDASGLAHDVYSTTVTGSTTQTGIDYELRTRGYSMKDYGRKKYTRAITQIQASTDDSCDLDFYFNTEDPDSNDTLVTDIATLLDVNIGLPGQLDSGESADFVFRLGNPRGVYGVLTIKRKILGSSAIGRPKVTSIAVEGVKTSRQTLTQF